MYKLYIRYIRYHYSGLNMLTYGFVTLKCRSFPVQWPVVDQACAQSLTQWIVA